MHTQCPHCHTTFGVNAAQLRAAHGQVRCGGCRSVFDGVECLIDNTIGGNVPGQPDSGLASGNGEKSQPGDHQIADATAAVAAPPVLEPNAAAVGDPIPAVLKDDIARARKARPFTAGSLMSTILALVLLAGLGAQFAWFEPARLLVGYPNVRPWLEKFCVATGCTLPDRRNPSKIQMLARDVRVHPKYEGALLVTATLMNVARHAQPYPRMRFSVFNVNGQTIASRTLEPEEYLSADVDVAGEMIPGKPVQVAIELIAPEEAAVSYEFRFQ